MPDAMSASCTPPPARARPSRRVLWRFARTLRAGLALPVRPPVGGSLVLRMRLCRALTSLPRWCPLLASREMQTAGAGVVPCAGTLHVLPSAHGHPLHA